MANLKTALITGGAGQTGSAIAKKLSALGYKLVIADIDKEKADAVAKDLENASAIGYDALLPESCSEMAANAKDILGGFSVIVHAVSKRVWKKAQDMTPDEWKNIFAINFHSLANTVRALTPYMKEQESCRFIHINAKSGKLGVAGESACSAAMHAARGYVRCMAVELAPYNIRANSICPGDMPELNSFKAALEMCEDGQILVNAPSKLFKDTCTLDDITNLVEFLASGQADFMSGQAFNLTGGQIMY